MSLKVYILKITFLSSYKSSKSLQTFLGLSVADLASEETYKGVPDFEVP